jgi:hypothetical protein
MCGGSGVLPSGRYRESAGREGNGSGKYRTPAQNVYSIDASQTLMLSAVTPTGCSESWHIVSYYRYHNLSPGSQTIRHDVPNADGLLNGCSTSGHKTKTPNSPM